MKLKVLYVVVICSLLLGLAVPCFADSFGTQPFRVANAPKYVTIYRGSSNSSPQFYTLGNPYVYPLEAIQDILIDYGTADYVKPVTSTASSAMELRMRFGYSYFTNNVEDRRIQSAFETKGNSASLDYLSDVVSFVTPMQYYFEDMYITSENSPIFDFYLDADATSDVVPHITYQRVLMGTDGTTYIETFTKDVPFSLFTDGFGTYVHQLDLYNVVESDALVQAMYIDFPFEAQGTQRYHYNDDYGMRVDFGYQDVTYTSILRDWYHSYEREGDFFKWVFDSLESLFTYPLFYVENVPVTPFGVFSLTFGLAIFVWLLKVFAGG